MPMSTDLWKRIISDTAVAEYRFGTRRAVPPDETLRRIRPLLRAAGITRLADVTGLDWLGIPVYQAIRPNSRALSASQGKGLTRAQAQISALMEALEVFHAEQIAQPGVRETVGQMRRCLSYDPRALALVHPRLLNDALPVDWVPATDLSTGAPTWVPRQLCELDLCVRERVYVPVFRTSSNGLCSGNTVAEALIHGLCEVIERDSLRRRDQARLEPRRSVMPRTVSSRLGRRLLDRFFRAGMELQIVDMSGPTDLPCFEVFIDHPDGPGLTEGSGCHLSRSTALVRALTEAAQSRLTYIAGNRDDIPRGVYRAPTRPSGRWAFRPTSADAERSFDEAPTAPAGGFLEQLHDLVRRVRALTGMSPLAVDLARPELGLPVLFVVAPGLRARTRL
jgi:ribosomal protein S12 methylthiotransferase accessory factor